MKDVPCSPDYMGVPKHCRPIGTMQMVVDHDLYYWIVRNPDGEAMAVFRGGMAEGTFEVMENDEVDHYVRSEADQNGDGYRVYQQFLDKDSKPGTGSLLPWIPLYIIDPITKAEYDTFAEFEMGRVIDTRETRLKKMKKLE